MTKPTTHHEALIQIANLGTCANGKTPAYKLFQQALDIAVAALDIPVYHNPKPVAAHLQPIFDENNRVGLLLIQRGDNLGWAFPSGWIENTDDSAETAARRESDEETGIVTHNGELFYSEITPGGIIMLFSRCPVALSIDELIFFKPNREALAVRVAYEPEELVFSSHTEAMKRWFKHKPPVVDEDELTRLAGATYQAAMRD
ncbi:NUDIX domain-containing protein [Sphingobium sp. MK2]|uniref:NUDIX domain-containing protein n=1 Tax=Sphingobium sp. MK2 TaxID=3116540 RepID=UPI0032E35AA5